MPFKTVFDEQKPENARSERMIAEKINFSFLRKTWLFDLLKQSLLKETFLHLTSKRGFAQPKIKRMFAEKTHLTFDL